MNLIVKKSVPHLIAMAIFLLLTCVYFSPVIFEGKQLRQGDMQQVVGMAEELHRYYNEEGGKSAWTGSMFSGMPSYTITVHGNPPNYLTYLEKPLKVMDYGGASMILTALVCFYILMCVMGIKRWLAIAGSVAFAFASYNLIIIAVGHITKMYVIAYMPLTIAGILLLFKKNRLWGTILLILGISLSIMNNHIQITYYLALFSVLFFIGLSINELKKKEYSFLAKITGIVILVMIVSVLPSIGGMYSNYEMGRESLRGPSELTNVSENEGDKVSSGLDMDYAFRWSYGQGELLTLFIPNAYGGSSHETLDGNSEFYKTYKSLGGNVGKEVQAPTYWGNQPFTSGPVYFGAIVCFLFVLGMFVIKNPLKWWIAGASLLFVLMSLGKNFTGLNEFLFYNLPQYNKFRVPAMILVIPGLTFPFIGFWGLKQIVEEKIDARQLKKSLIWALSVTGGLSFLIWVMPGAFLGFEPTDPALLSTYEQWPLQLTDALISDRKSMASSDALRSLIYILLASGLVYFFLTSKNKKTAATVLSLGLFVLITIDLWTVDKRYLNDSSFVSKQKISEYHKKTKADEYILQDNSPSYRVLNLSGDAFNEANTSYFHKSIGGYNAAKLRRYQELIDRRIGKEVASVKQTFQTATSEEDILLAFENTPTLNMLNAKYIIYNPNQAPIVNPYIDGNAWFVHEVKWVDNADREIEALDTIDPKTTAVIDKKFADRIKENPAVSDTVSSIQLLEYKPDYLKYSSISDTGGLAVFSEIYYQNGWKAFIDGQPADHVRADWTLRAMNIPAGSRTIEFRFEPDKYNTMVRIGSVASLLILLGIIGVVVFYLLKSYRKTK